MLVLSRKSGDTVMIDGDIQVTVLEVRGNHVRLGLQAPAAVAIRRAELPRNLPTHLKERAATIEPALEVA